MRGAVAGSLLLSVMINVMFFLGFPPVAQYVAQGLIIIGAVALPRPAPSAERMSGPSTRHAFRRGGWLSAQPAVPLVLVVAAVWIVAGLLKPGFGSFGHLRYLLELAAVIGLVAAGQTLVVIAGGIDLSVGGVVTVSAVGVPLVASGCDATGLVGVVVMLADHDRVGILNGLGVALLRVHPMIMTLAMATFLQGVAHPHRRRQRRLDAESGRRLARQRPGPRRAGDDSAWLVVAALILILLHATPFGVAALRPRRQPAGGRLVRRQSCRSRPSRSTP